MILWSRLDHSNVLPFLGFFTEESKRFSALVSEFMKNGSMIKYMQDRSFDARGMCETASLVLAFLMCCTYFLSASDIRNSKRIRIYAHGAKHNPRRFEGCKSHLARYLSRNLITPNSPTYSCRTTVDHSLVVSAFPHRHPPHLYKKRRGMHSADR